MRLKLTISYLGAPFAGWQSQTHGGAVQDAVEKALAEIVGTRIVLHGAGRTDAGVHALGQCAHADVPDGSLQPGDWLRALNARLPTSLRVIRAQPASADFHARFSAKGKMYRYLLRHTEVLSPLEAGRVWQVPQTLDAGRLAEAAAIFAGRHDFRAFSANRGDPVLNTHRTIHSVRAVRTGTLWTLTFEGEGFLYKMVRMLTAAIVRAAQGRETVENLAARLAQGGPRWNHVAPAEGLYLVRVLY